ncbi:MAG TPA: GNAT family N-acetyltransferase, partial [Chromatiaceae bacterium]|nr:GNAT family N-acetyltransferase [Chromatiaceae bacterium]
MPSVRTLYWPDDYEAILNHLRLCYSPDEYDMLAAAYGDAPSFDPANCFVIEGDRSEIAAHIMVTPRQLQIGPSTLPTAEISLLSVQPAYQGRGYEGRLLEAAHERMTEAEYALGLSFGDPLLFEMWGYEYALGLYLTSYESDIALEHALKAGAWDRQHAYERRTADRLGTHNRDLVVRRFYSSDLPAVMALYTEASVNGHYALTREEDIWSWQIDYLMRVGRSEADDFLVVEADDQLAAYARLVTQGTVNTFAGNG